jgi:hypothetical protein
MIHGPPPCGIGSAAPFVGAGFDEGRVAGGEFDHGPPRGTLFHTLFAPPCGIGRNVLLGGGVGVGVGVGT